MTESQDAETNHLPTVGRVGCYVRLVKKIISQEHLTALYTYSILNVHYEDRLRSTQGPAFNPTTDLAFRTPAPRPHIFIVYCITFSRHSLSRHPLTQLTHTRSYCTACTVDLLGES
jgi:hypothetical protein